MRCFEISGSFQEPEKTYRTNVICIVAATNAQRAIELVMQKHPGIEVWSLQHRSRVDIIEDSALEVRA